jgi:hypothetical protein
LASDRFSQNIWLLPVVVAVAVGFAVVAVVRAVIVLALPVNLLVVALPLSQRYK